VVFALTFVWAACATSSASTDDADVSPPSDAAVATADANVGDPDAAVARTGATATGTVSGSVKASSPNYKLIGTVNAGTRNSKSTQYKKRGGVVGATQP
jgi:hypothetical protein